MKKICRVRLRPLQKKDKGLLYEWITDRDLVLLNSTYAPISEGEHEQWFDSILRKRSDLAFFAIEETEENLVIGTCQLFNISPVHRNAELQIRIGDQRFQGRGYGVEAIGLLTAFGFFDLNLHRIYLRVFSTNQRAFRAYLKCGFKHEGTARQAAFLDGKWVDVDFMAKLSDDV